MKRRMLPRALYLVFLLSWVGCTGQGSFNAFSPSENLGGSNGDCSLADASLRNPTTIDQVTDLINALPKPLSIPCLIENLPTPLRVYAVNGIFSAQPSAGPDSPRIFIMNGDLVLSVVPAGSGKNFLEYGQFINAVDSVKAELEFPIKEEILPSAPYSSIRNGMGTTCRSCHGSEGPVNGYGGEAFASAAVFPNASQRQAAARLETVAKDCDKSADPYRCQMLNSIFVKGKAQDAELPYQ